MPVTNYHTVNGRLIGETTSGVRTDYLTDALGSITATVNESAQIINTYRYKPFGERLAKTGSGADPRFQFTGDTGSATTSRRYAENYNRRRSLDVKNGRWGSVDPIWPGEAAYAYARANPSTRIDPSGTQLSGNPLLDPPIPLLDPKPGPRPAPNPLINPGPVPPRPGPPPPGPLIVIIGGVIAVVDLVNYICTGKPGPFTGIGEALADWLIPEPEDQPRSPRDCPKGGPRTLESAEARRKQLMKSQCPNGLKLKATNPGSAATTCIGYHQTNVYECKRRINGKTHTKMAACSILCCLCISPGGGYFYDCFSSTPHADGDPGEPIWP